MQFWKKSLMAQLVSYFLLLSLVTVSLGVSIAYFQAQRALEQSVFDRLTAAAILKEQEFNRWAEDQQQVVASIVQLPEVEAQAELLLKQKTGAIQLEASVNSVHFSPDGRWIVTSGIDRTTRVLDAATGQAITHIEHESSSVGAFTPDGRWLVTSGNDNNIRIWDPASGQAVGRIPHDSNITAWTVSADSRLIATGTFGVIRVWELATGQIITQIEDDLDYVNSLDFNPDGRWLASATDDKTGRVWDVATGQEISRVEHDGWVLFTQFSPDGQWVVTGGEDYTAILWEAATGREIAQFYHDNWVTSAAFTSDGRWLATSSDDRTARVWDTTTGESIAELPHSWPVSSVIFSPDDQMIATQANFGGAHIWQAATGDLLSPLDLFDQTPDNWAYDIDFSPDSRQLITGSQDGTARLWQVDSGAELWRVTHDSENYTVLSKSLQALSASQSDLQEISLLTTEGQVIVSTNKAHEGHTVAGADYLVNGLTAPYKQNLYLDSNGKPAITIVAPLLDVDSEEGTLGLLVVHLNLERMDAIMAERSGLGQSGKTYLVNQESQLASGIRYGSPEFPDRVESQGITAALQGNNSSGLYTNYAGAPVVGVYRWLDQQELALLAEMDQQEAYAPARRLAATTFVSMLILAGLLAVAVYLLARQIAQPILAITSGAEAVEATTFIPGSLNHVAGRTDELGVLARVFEHMAHEVYTREERLKKEVIELRIEIDQTKKAQEVAAITGSDYFRELQEKAKALREKNSEDSLSES